MALDTGHRVTKDFVFFDGGFLDPKYKAPMNIEDGAYSSVHEYITQRQVSLAPDFGILAYDDLEKLAVRGNLAKFEQHDELKEKLLKFPISAAFVNADTDLVWCSGIKLPQIESLPRTSWTGRNLMGIALTKVRGILIEKAFASTYTILTSQRALLVSFGYIRRDKLFEVLSIPSDIVQLVAMFCTFMFEEIRFTCYNKKNCIAENDGMVLKTSANPDRVKCHRLFVADKHGFNHDVVCWRLKFTCNDIGSEGAIGVVSGINNKNTVLHQRPWINDGCFADTTYWSRSVRKITAPALMGKSAKSLGSCQIDETWSDGDIIDVKLDCEKWCIQFYRNERLLTNDEHAPDGKISLYPNKTYYPIIAFFEKSDVYSVLTE